jgi:hypothetical protein
LCPDIPVIGDAFILQPEFVRGLRSVIVKTQDLFERLQIPCWLTGGSLLGVVRHGAIPMPFDDDADMAVDYQNKQYMFSSEFVEEAKKNQLRVLYLMTNGHETADRHGAAVRFQSLDGGSQTIDVFFWEIDHDKKSVSKIDGWSTNVLTGTLTTARNLNETFPYEDVYPLRPHVNIDDLLVTLPQNPRALLEKQYSPEVFDRVKARPMLFSHKFMFTFFWWLWK